MSLNFLWEIILVIIPTLYDSHEKNWLWDIWDSQNCCACPIHNNFWMSHAQQLCMSHAQQIVVDVTVINCWGRGGVHTNLMENYSLQNINMFSKNTRIIFSDPKLTYNSCSLLRKCVVFEHYNWVTCTVQKFLWESPACIMSLEPNMIVYAENLCLCKFQIP